MRLCIIHKRFNTKLSIVILNLTSQYFMVFSKKKKKSQWQYALSDMLCLNSVPDRKYTFTQDMLSSSVIISSLISGIYVASPPKLDHQMLSSLGSIQNQPAVSSNRSFIGELSIAETTKLVLHEPNLPIMVPLIILWNEIPIYTKSSCHFIAFDNSNTF